MSLPVPGSTRPQRRWYKKKRYLLPLALFFVLGVIGEVSPQQEVQPAASTQNSRSVAAPDESPALVVPDAATQAAAADAAAKQAADLAAKQAAAKKAAAQRAAAKRAADAAAKRAAARFAAEAAAKAAAAKRAAQAAAAQAAAAAPPAGARTFDNCTEMRTGYPHGVGRPGAVDQTSGSPVTTFERSAALYEANSGSDRDDDGIACEQK
jgi:hypothetical protein